MAWYWLILIIATAVIIGYIKLRIYKNWMEKKIQAANATEEED